MPLIQLLYASEAVGVLPYGSLVGIMSHAQVQNPARGITGLLCYGSGQFLQALEGEREAVTALYHQIALDPRHDHCHLLSVTEIARRDFAEWSMKVVNWEDGDTARRRAILATDTGRDVFAPREMSAAQAAAFLRHVADLERELTRDD